MARVAVVGAGLAGCATAVRVAKLGHEVTLIERLPVIGGALGYVQEAGFRWDAGPSSTTLPAALRDLFRKSGRPLDRELELVELPVLREHRFSDGSRLTIPTGRHPQREALDDLGVGLGAAWLGWTEKLARVWELLRRDYLERPYSRDHAPRELSRLLRDRQSLHRAVRRLDPRLRCLAMHHAMSAGHDPRNVPWWMGFLDHVEQTFGTWTSENGLGTLTGLLEKRLGERGVTVMTGTTVDDVLPGTGVRVGDDEIAADVIVCAIDPRQLPSLAPYVERTTPALPPTVCHVGLEGDLPEVPHEVVLHGEATITITTGGAAPPGMAAWTVSARGRLAEDVLAALARRQLDLRANVVHRVDRSPREQVERYAGSPYGVLWQGRRTTTHQLGARTPLPGVYAVGAHTTLSASLPFVALTATQAADAIGTA